MIRALLIIAITAAVWLLIPRLMRLLMPWLQRMALRRVGKKMGIDPDLMQQMFGGGPASPKGSARRDARRDSGRASSFRDREDTAQSYGPSSSREPLIPKEYAEDVEFTEVHSSSTETVVTPDATAEIHRESSGSFFRRGRKVEGQVSDAEIIEITRY